MEHGSVTQSFNYDQGQVECEKFGTGLAIIRNQSDYNALMSTINKSGILLNKPTQIEVIDNKIWISGRRSAGLWEWYTGEVIPTPWFWSPGQPDDTFDGCARIYTGVSPFQINDNECGAPGHLYFKLACE